LSYAAWQMQQAIQLFLDEAAQFSLVGDSPPPRLARAFKHSMGAGMLDLLLHGVAQRSSPALIALHGHAQRLSVDYLRSRRQGMDASLRPSRVSLPAIFESLPPILGSDLSLSILEAGFLSFEQALFAKADAAGISPEDWLAGLSDDWKQLGMLCLHLAENAADDRPDLPFAFMLTFVHQLGSDQQARHLPLALAMRHYAQDKQALMGLLRPLQKVAQSSPFLRELIESGAIYRACAWNARQAYALLELIPQLREAGIESRMVNLWKTLPPKVELELRIKARREEGEEEDAAPQGGLNIHSLLQFMPRVALGNHTLTEEELEELLAGDDGLVRFRGDWVRLDRAHLESLLKTWRQASQMAAGGIPLLVGLRFLLGKRRDAIPELPPIEEGLRVLADESLERALETLRLGQWELSIDAQLHSTLRPYQREGASFLLNLTEAGFGACLADDMGLGKSIQVIAWLCHLQRMGILEKQGALLVAPASLLDNWRAEIQRFAPHLTCFLLHPAHLSPQDEALLRRDAPALLGRAHVILSSYGVAARHAEALGAVHLPALILDEAQAIKNFDSQRSRAMRRLSAARRVAMSGTPIENSLEELFSLMHFLNPGLLGTPKGFQAMLREMKEDYAPLRRLIRPFILRRLKTDRTLLPDLPPKIEKPHYCYLSEEQARLYAHEVARMQMLIQEPDPQARMALILPQLMRFKQICNHPAQYLGEPHFEPERSGKMMALRELLRGFASRGECCLIFTQYRSMMEALHDMAAEVYARPGLLLHGGTPIAARQGLVDQFQHPDGPPFMLLSLKAAGTGLTLTRAHQVVHFDRWWNPAVERQASDRAHRMGQTRPVTVHPMICRGTLEENVHRMLERKQALADDLLSGGFEKMLLHMDAAELLTLCQAGE